MPLSESVLLDYQRLNQHRYSSYNSVRCRRNRVPSCSSSQFCLVDTTVTGVVFHSILRYLGPLSARFIAAFWSLNFFSVCHKLWETGCRIVTIIDIPLIILFRFTGTLPLLPVKTVLHIGLLFQNKVAYIHIYYKSWHVGLESGKFKCSAQATLWQ